MLCIGDKIMDIDNIFSSLIKEMGYQNNKTVVINKVVMNSKEVEKNNLFVAIRGGNAYANEALEKGAFVIYDDNTINLNSNPNSFLVDDSVKFMQGLAHQWRNTLNIKIIGITGSNGKTTVKDMVFQLLSTKYKGKKTEGNYNNHIGLPFTLLRSEKNDDFMVLEMGMSDFGEIELLAKISEPNVGIITNIGDSHLEFLKTRENVFKAKTEMLPFLKETLIINSDDEYLSKIDISKNQNINKMYEVKRFEGDKKPCKYSYKIESITDLGSKFIFYYSPEPLEESTDKVREVMLETNVIGEHNISNLCLAITCALNLGVSEAEIVEATKNIKLTDMRFQKIETNNMTYINDAYNASPISMEKAINTFSSIYNEGSYKVIVLGDILELGPDENRFHEEIKEHLLLANHDEVLLFGSRMQHLYNALKNDLNYTKKIQHYDDKNEMKKEIEKIKIKQELKGLRTVALLKASRGMKLEEVIEKGI
jgi:UDP-N-acetylmuramoyl-tripeptide--D-alanyl-D-alanine ligase